jgi:hypothetical protein
MTEKIYEGTVRKIPSDMRESICYDPFIRAIWQSLTPLGRNEWICWTVSVQLPITRKKHIDRTVSELRKGKRRPCCWMGCVHRTDKAISPSAQHLLDRRSKNK